MVVAVEELVLDFIVAVEEQEHQVKEIAEVIIAMMLVMVVLDPVVEVQVVLHYRGVQV
jgi:hypothetical protein